MKTVDFVHLALLALGGEVHGKTNLQKKLYFVGLLTGKLDELGYRPHFYGPYSEDVAMAVEDLKTVGFLDQSVVGPFAVDTAGFELKRYDYRLNEVGTRVAQERARLNPDLWAHLERAAGVLRTAGDLDYMKLSIAAKTYFMLGQHRKAASNEELARLAVRFGWRVSPDEVQEAARYLQKLDLVEL